MLNKIGRLDMEDKREINSILKEAYNLLDENKKEEAEGIIFDLAKTQNYFVREYTGKEFLNYHNQHLIHSIAKKMLGHKLYGIRATSLFYFYSRFKNDPHKVIDILEVACESTPWEVESIVNELWKRFPDIMKERVIEWIKSENVQMRTTAFHGMENIIHTDPVYIMNFIGKAIDDQSLDVQKKITHILTQVAREKPVIVYPYIHEWLLEADNKRAKTIWISMKKLANIVVQKSRREKSKNFVTLTQQTIYDWALDENIEVANMGKKLKHIISR